MLARSIFSWIGTILLSTICWATTVFAADSEITYFGPNYGFPERDSLEFEFKGPDAARLFDSLESRAESDFFCPSEDGCFGGITKQVGYLSCRKPDIQSPYGKCVVQVPAIYVETPATNLRVRLNDWSGSVAILRAALRNLGVGKSWTTTDGRITLTCPSSGDFCTISSPGITVFYAHGGGISYLGESNFLTAKITGRQARSLYETLQLPETGIPPSSTGIRFETRKTLTSPLFDLKCIHSSSLAREYQNQVCIWRVKNAPSFLNLPPIMKGSFDGQSAQMLFEALPGGASDRRFESYNLRIACSRSNDYRCMIEELI